MNTPLVRYEQSVGFPPSTLSEQDQADFRKYTKAYLPKPTEKALFDGKTTNMNFKYFLTVYRLCLMWSHNYFKTKKTEFSKKRRALLEMKTEDPQVRQLMLFSCGQMQQAERQNISEFVTLLGSYLPIHIEDYNRNIFEF